MILPRLRMIAGPNGSGKSTLFEFLQRQTSFRLGHCLNPDTIERSLMESGRVDFRDWDLQVHDESFRAFCAAHGLREKLDLSSLSVVQNVLQIDSRLAGGYFAAVLSDFMRRQWLAARESFTFETVMSSADKIELLEEGLTLGFRSYLYYICTDSPTINRERVASRVSQGGHDVPRDKIASRYGRSLSLLPGAIRKSSRAYLFDNSQDRHELIAEFDAGRLVKISQELPGWFVKSVLSHADLMGGSDQGKP
jgi:predicted ABC-type ATPase